MRFVALDGRERALTLTERGHHLLEAHRRDRDEAREQAFYAGVSRPRELSHDVQLYRAYLREEERLRDQGAEIRARRPRPRAQARVSGVAPGARIAAGRTATDDPIATPAKSNAGRTSTTCRTSTSRSTSPTSASSTSCTDATVTRTSRWSPSTIAAPTPRAWRGRDSDATDAAAAAVGVADVASIRAWPRSSCDPTRSRTTCRTASARVASRRSCDLGFTERQARFLVHVLVFSGVFLERQYRAFTGLAHGQKTHDFLAKLVSGRLRDADHPWRAAPRPAVSRPVQAALRGHRRAE